MSDAHEALVEALSRPEAWGGPVEVRKTHASVVFLVGDRAYKIKRPVDLGFLDFTTLEKRAWFCAEEVRLNRRLAPGVYLGVAPITADLRVRGEGPVVEWAVEMDRLDDAASLAAHLERGEVDVATIRAVARVLAAFHAGAARGPEISRFGRADVVAGNARENFAQSRDQIGRTVTAAVHARLAALTEAALARLGPTFDRRAAAGRTRDTHGDLRVDHVYLLPGGPVVIDCVEFSERFRFADPVSDLAFLVMDLAVRGHAALASALADAWFEATGDEEGRALLPFYVAYRSVVRAKVAGLALAVHDDAETVARARRHWLFALATLEEPARRPALVGVGGLPGTGKSTLAAGLAARGFEVIRSDVVRHELAGADTRAGFGQGVYTDAGKDRVYAACLDRAEAALLDGERVVVDASFWKERWREALVARARALGVPALVLLCEAPREVARARLRARVGDASDADEAVYDRALVDWEPPAGTASRCVSVRSDVAPEEVLGRAWAALVGAGLGGSRELEAEPVGGG